MQVQSKGVKIQLGVKAPCRLQIKDMGKLLGSHITVKNVGSSYGRMSSISSCVTMCSCVDSIALPSVPLHHRIEALILADP